MRSSTCVVIWSAGKMLIKYDSVLLQLWIGRQQCTICFSAFLDATTIKIGKGKLYIRLASGQNADKMPQCLAAAMDWKTCVLFCFYAFMDATTSSQIDCFLDEQQCQIEADNLINFFTEIPTSEECAQLCSDDSTCTAFTHFGATSYPLDKACFLFSSCRERRPCTDCITGSNQTDCTCSVVGYEGHLDGTNLVDFIGFQHNMRDGRA